MLKLHSWANPFPLPNSGEGLVVIRNDNCMFKFERGVIVVDTDVVSTANVEHIKRLCTKPKSAEVIQTELTLSFGEVVKNPFFIDHFGWSWFALKFIDEDERENVVEGHLWFVMGQIFHLQRWTTDFRESDPIFYLRLNILKTITKPIDDLVRLHDPCINSLNGMAIRALMEVVVRLPLKHLCGEWRQRAANLPQL
ncbi:hypothetical protein DVH24_034014 [Malus domestica]|uniref:DUF4283 domain-containing protein n=1 Tax=Malus domestica TaxID=3750 RepID=A0A498KP80_MALDO|nr:hypothetical protein DVH24_034014 [Malus domestica]